MICSTYPASLVNILQITLRFPYLYLQCLSFQGCNSVLADYELITRRTEGVVGPAVLRVIPEDEECQGM